MQDGKVNWAQGTMLLRSILIRRRNGWRIGYAITGKQPKREKIELFLSELKKQEDVITQFDENLWYSLVDYVTVFNKEDVRFTFKDGTKIKV